MDDSSVDPRDLKDQVDDLRDEVKEDRNVVKDSLEPAIDATYAEFAQSCEITTEYREGLIADKMREPEKGSFFFSYLGGDEATKGHLMDVKL